MRTVIIIGIIVGISLVLVFTTSEVIWYFANQEFEKTRDEFKESLEDTFVESESTQFEDTFEGSFEESFEGHTSELDATSSYMDKIVPTLDDFKNTLNESQDIDIIFSKFGEPHDDIGSGIHIYVYELNDSTQIWIGYADKIMYVKHFDSDGNLLEELF